MSELLTCAIFVFCAALAGVLNGLREMLHTNPTVFETSHGVAKRGWFGSESWVLKYKNYPSDQRSRFPGSKSGLAWATDFWHFSGMASKMLIVLAAWAAGGLGVWHVALLLAVHGMFSHFAYEYLKKKANGPV